MKAIIILIIGLAAGFGIAFAVTPAHEIIDVNESGWHGLRINTVPGTEAISINMTGDGANAGIVVRSGDRDDRAFVVKNGTKTVFTVNAQNGNIAIIDGVIYVKEYWIIDQQFPDDRSKDHKIYVKNHTMFLWHPNNEQNILNPIRCGSHETC